MSRISLLFVLLSIVLLAPSQDYLKEELFNEVKDVLFDLGAIEILDRVCNYRVMPSFEDRRFYFKGDVWCPGWAFVKGESLTRSRTSRVVNKAIADFAQKALAQGLITQEDAQPLLE